LVAADAAQISSGAISPFNLKPYGLTAFCCIRRLVQARKPCQVLFASANLLTWPARKRLKRKHFRLVQIDNGIYVFLKIELEEF